MVSYSFYRIVLLIVLLSLSAFFSAAETALMSLSKIRVRHMVDENIKGAVKIQQLVENPSRLIGTILVGNNIVNISASALATSIALEIFDKNAVAIATASMTVLVLVFAEITPKSLAAQNAEKIALRLSPLLSWIVTILNPIVIIFTKITNSLIRILGGKKVKDKPYITEEELKTIVNVSHEEGVLEVEEKQMIYNVFEFGDLQIKNVMIQRTDISAIQMDTSFQKVLEIIREEKYSRYPVYKRNFDDIVGVVYVKDLLLADEKEESFSVAKYMRKPYFTFEFQKITKLFKEMKKNRVHMAIVIDEYGGTAGIVTIEDLIEEIVGEIEDEYDELEQKIEPIGEGEYIVDGSEKITSINELFGFDIESEDFDSIGGFIIGELGRLPMAGDVVEYKHVKFTVEKTSRTRIEKIRIHL